MDIEENAMGAGAGRRTFLKTAAMTGVLAGAGTGRSEARIFGGKESRRTDRGLEYVEMITDMVRDLLKESSGRIAAAAEICAGAVSGGKRVFYTVRGHNEPKCILEDRPGKPSFLLPTEKSLDYSLFQPGDVLITERTEFCAPARERGARIIGILMPFQPQKTQGQGIVHRDYEGPWMEDICEVCIWDRTPYTVGTMSFDQLPIKAVPAHGAMDGIILNLILAGTIDRLIARGIPVTVDS